jgi:predicted dehydrogenase
VGIPILTERVDAANARLEFATGAVANITASRVGTEKIRKMRFFQPHDYVTGRLRHQLCLDQQSRASSAAPWPGVKTQVLPIDNVEPLRAEIASFLQAASNGSAPPVSGDDGRRALALALRTLEQIHQHTVSSGMSAFLKKP